MGIQRSHLLTGAYLLVVIFLCLSFLDGLASALGPVPYEGCVPPARVVSRSEGGGTRSWSLKILQVVTLHMASNADDTSALSPNPAQYIAAFLSMVLFMFLLLKAAYRMWLLMGCAAFACPDISLLSRFLGGHAPPPGGERYEAYPYALA